MSQLDVSLEGIDTNTRGEIKQVFNEYGRDVKFDKKLMKDIMKYVSSFVNKNEDSINFFGDSLLGVYPVKYTKEDKDIWFDEVLNLDEISVRKDLHALDAIEPAFRVSSDVTNQSFIWAVHMFSHTKELSTRDKEEVCVEILNMMQYKFLTSLMSHYFRYAADKSVALATYAELSKKFSLKVHGSWAKLVRARSESILDRDSIHFKAFYDYKNDQDIVKMINDIQGRIREIVKSIMEVFYRVLEADSRIASTSSVFEMEGVQHVADRKDNYGHMRKYLQEVSPVREDLIKEQLVKVIISTIHTASPRHLEEGLMFLSDNYGARRMSYLEELIDKTLIFSMNFLRDNDIALNDLPQVLTRLRSIYTSSRGSDELLMEVKELGDKLVKDSVQSRNPAALISARSALLLYITLRALTERSFG